MYGIGDLIVYGHTGVCKIEDIALLTPSSLPERDTQLYYILKPLYQKGTIYTPADPPKVFMRPVMSPDEANQLIDCIPAAPTEIFRCKSLPELKRRYREASLAYDCNSLMSLVLSIRKKKEEAEKQKKKIGQIDLRFMKQTEDLLFGELAVSLGIPRDTVPAYISQRISILW
ncbi:MAG TPA: CarD family transcriptional regulator [Candidatus Hungatella pullicola]|nr:CarD family transcriptional regulator [Candidatus Hungatella pullicola]